MQRLAGEGQHGREQHFEAAHRLQGNVEGTAGRGQIRFGRRPRACLFQILVDKGRNPQCLLQTRSEFACLVKVAHGGKAFVHGR